MKILVLTSTYPRWANDTEPRFVADLNQVLAQKHEVHVLAPHTKGTKQFETVDGINIHRFRYCLKRFEVLAYDGGILPKLKSSPLHSLLIPLFLGGQFIKTLRLLKQYEFEVIHAHWIIPQGVTLALVKILTKAVPAVIITSHGGDLFSLNHPLAQRIKQWVLNNCDFLTVVSNTMKQRAVDLGVPSHKIQVAPMGVDLLHKFTPPEAGANRGGVIFVGRLVEKKGVKYLIRAFKEVLLDHPDEILTIVGSGPLRPQLDELTKELGVDKNVVFRGSIENQLIPIELRQSKIAVIPSVVTGSGDQEGLGLTIIEALGCECAVVASDLPAIRDILPDERFGLLSEPCNTADIARNIKVLLANDELRSSKASLGRERCLKMFTWKAAGMTYISLFEKLEKTYKVEY